jgi:GMP synthase (glutamine-hydrolysing)
MLTTFKGATKEALLEIEEEKKIRLTDEVFLLFSLGSQFDHLIKLALGKLGVFCLVADPASVTAEDVKKVNPIGIILSGGPASVHAEPPKFDSKIFDLGIPVLGICLGFQLWAQHIGLNVELADHREFGVHEIDIRSPKSDLFRGCAKQFKALQSHGDIVTPDPSLQITARSDNSPVAAAEHKHLHGVQFHPEVTHTEKGLGIFENFCFLICDAKDRFPAEAIAEKKIHELRTQIGDKKVLLALSGLFHCRLPTERSSAGTRAPDQSCIRQGHRQARRRDICSQTFRQRAMARPERCRRCS